MKPITSTYATSIMACSFGLGSIRFIMFIGSAIAIGPNIFRRHFLFILCYSGLWVSKVLLSISSSIIEIYSVACNFCCIGKMITWHISLQLQLIERDVAQWLGRAALPMSLPVVRFRIPLGAGFSEKYHVSPLSILGHYFDAVSLCKALYPHMLHLTQV